MSLVVAFPLDLTSWKHTFFWLFLFVIGAVTCFSRQSDAQHMFSTVSQKMKLFFFLYLYWLLTWKVERWPFLLKKRRIFKGFPKRFTFSSTKVPHCKRRKLLRIPITDKSLSFKYRLFPGRYFIHLRIPFIRIIFFL